MKFFSTSERLEIGDVPFVSHGDKPTRRESLEYFRRVTESWNLNVNTYETVKNIDGEKDNFIVMTDKGRYTGRDIIIATGFYDKPNLMNVPGEELPKVHHYFKEAHPYAYHKLLIVGAGNSAVDVALETYRRGSDVTIVIREDKLKDSVKYWVKPDLENRIKEGTIKAYFNSKISEIKEKEIDIKTPDGIMTVENDFVFAMTGYQPDFSFLKNAGVTISDDEAKTPQFDESTFETNRKGIYLAGVVCGGMETGKWFIENSRDHAINIFDKIEKDSKT
jgi:thioredoxin reductase (NADPH)